MAKTYAVPYAQTLKTQWTLNITAANTAKDGTGTVNLGFTAGMEGSRIDQIKARAKGTNVATVLRIFINNGQDPIVAANNTLIHEKTLAATILSEVAELADIDILISKNTGENVPPVQTLPANYRLYFTLGTAVATGWQITVSGADY